MPTNLIQHVEWTTRDPERLRSFFSRIFDWSFSEAMPGYTMIEGVGGIFAAPDPQMPLGVTPYVNVADLGEKEARITQAGGTIYKSKQEVPGMGWFTIFSDPDGNTLAMWQAANPPRRSATGGTGARKRTAGRGQTAARKTAKRKTAAGKTAARTKASRGTGARQRRRSR